MRIQVVSDLHLERCLDNVLPFNEVVEVLDDTTVLVLAGDIGDPFSGIYKHFLAWCIEQCTCVILVAGNNEYRHNKQSKHNGQTISDIDAHINRVCYEIDNSRTRLVYLQGGAVYCIDDIQFIGATLWSSIPQHILGMIDETLAEEIQHKLRDINIGKNTPLTISSMNALHLSHRTGIYNAIMKGMKHGYRNIVVSHHCPILYTPTHAGTSKMSQEISPIEYMYANDLTCFMGFDIVHCWIYGHTHRNIHKNASGTICITNQYGHQMKPLSGFSKTYVVDV